MIVTLRIHNVLALISRSDGTKRQSCFRHLCPHYSRWHMLHHVRRLSSHAFLGRHNLLLWIIGLWVKPDVSTYAWAGHAPVWVSIVYSNTSDSWPHRSWCHTQCKDMPTSDPLTAVFVYMQWFYNVPHPYMRYLAIYNGSIMCHILTWHKMFWEHHLGQLIRRYWKRNRLGMTTPMMFYRPVGILRHLRKIPYREEIMRNEVLV